MVLKINVDEYDLVAEKSADAAVIEASTTSAATSATSASDNSKSHYNQQFYFESSSNTAANIPPKKPAGRIRQGGAAAGIIIGTVIGALVGAGTGITVAQLSSQPASVTINNPQDVNWVTAVAAKASPSVVTISVSATGTGGSGSGVILSDDGYILTNTHVVTLEGATATPTIEVKTNDGKVYPAEIVGTDPTNDLAVIKVTTAAKFTPIEFADSDKLNVGDPVVAIGAPLGLEETVTSGIISSLNRTIQVANSAAPENGENGSGGLQLWNNGSGVPINLTVIQTDAAINPGNSGGALLDQNGNLIGINVAIASAGSSGSAGSIGVGFSIPSNTAKRIADEIQSSGTASHGLLGASVSDATSSDSTASFTVGAKVEQLSAGGPAEKAGLQVGDIVTQCNGREITSAGDLTAAIRQQPAGASVTLTVIRGKETISIDAILGDAADLKQ